MTAYAPPIVTVEPVTDRWVPGSTVPGYSNYGVANRPEALVMLNLHTGRLTAVNALPAFDRDMHRRDRRSWQATGWYHHGPAGDIWMRGLYWGRTPTSLAWAVDFGDWVKTAAGVNAALETIVPLAQELVNTLDPVPGTDGEYDWTLRAATVERAVHFAFTSCFDGVRADVAGLRERPGDGVVTFAEVIEADPDLVDPLWAVMSDDELDEVAEQWTGSETYPAKWISGRRRTGRRLCEKFGWGSRSDGLTAGDGDGRFDSSPTFAVLHARSDLRFWRDGAVERATGLSAVYAVQVFPGGYDGDDFDACCTDEQVGALAARLDATIAYQDKVSVLGTERMLLQQRAVMRQRVRREARADGERVADLKRQLGQAMATRDGRLWQVIGFGEQPEHNEDGTVNFAEIGRLGSMSRVAAGTKFRAGDPEDVEDEPDCGGGPGGRELPADSAQAALRFFPGKSAGHLLDGRAVQQWPGADGRIVHAHDKEIENV